ncbi:V-type ATP synthase subunit I domain-containing protein [Mycoplasma parvum]|uniref:Uncharacterized protein n=1 Tax=Mycoplasma parvum str. Indiana TaxID=1403316 RepID=U5NC45_9MOLU|nr:hypothetical protein [Mycoplasma parvum]AGX88855.1 hypothetical protein PRV_00400 [Mycoplasma parvum str. Indiana]
MESILKSEKELSDLYKNNLETKNNLSKLLENINKYQEKHLELEATLNAIRNSINLLNSIYKAINNWSNFFDSLYKIVETETNKTFRGGQQESNNNNLKGNWAKEKLQNFKQNIMKENSKAINKLLQINYLSEEFLKKEFRIVNFINDIKLKMRIFERFFSSLKLESRILEMEINEIIKKLNELQKQLTTTYKKLQNLKDKVPIFQNYEGILKNNICQNIEMYKQENKQKVSCIENIK